MLIDSAPASESSIFDDLRHQVELREILTVAIGNVDSCGDEIKMYMIQMPYRVDCPVSAAKCCRYSSDDVVHPKGVIFV